MINNAAFLSNTKVTIYRKNSQVKSSTGNVVNTYVVIYQDILARIEHQEVATPITISGKSLRDFYLMQTWRDINGALYEIQDGDIIEETDCGKSYEAVDIQGGSLFKDKRFKLQTKMLVMNDSRYKQFIQKV